MKSTNTIFIAFLMVIGVFAQAPQKMSYQAIIKNVDATLLVNTKVGLKISVLNGTAAGTVVYSETHTAITNGNGLVSIQIGTGTVKSGSFSGINWAIGTYYIKTETDPSGGTNYSITGTSQFVSVPYALHAKTAETLTGSIVETDPRVPTGTVKGEIQYWNGSTWTTLVPGNDGAILTIASGLPTWVGGTTLPTVPTVTNPTTGKIWMDRNLGASQVATSSIDVAAYGDLYQWGRNSDGHEKRTSGTTTTLSSSDIPGHGNFIITSVSPYDWRSSKNDNLWQGVNGINNPCPSGYRVPTEAEWNTESLSWGIDNATGAFNSSLKLTVSGYRDSDGFLSSIGTVGIYWTSTTSGFDSKFFCFDGSISALDLVNRAFGFSVRCIKN